MEKNCSICKRLTDSEDSPILVMGGFGNPKYLCPECARDMESVTEGKNYDEIKYAMDKIGEALSRSNCDDGQVIETVKSIFEEAGERAERIKSGEYDFESEEAQDTAESELDEADDVPEELRESEEDRLLDEHEEKVNKKIDSILTWVMAVIFIAAFVLLGIKVFA